MTDRDIAVRIHKVILRIINGISSPHNHEIAEIRLPDGARVQTVRFADEVNLLLEFHTEGELSYHPGDKALIPPANVSLVFVPFVSSSDSASGLAYNAANNKNQSSASRPVIFNLNDQATLERCLRHSFPSRGPWRSGAIELNGRVGRRSMCMLSSDKTNYRIYGLDPEIDQDRQSRDEGTLTKHPLISSQVQEVDMAM